MLSATRRAIGIWPSGFPAPPPAPIGPPVAAHASSRFERIAVEGGRVNFKRGDDKLPFAFVSVEGTVQADGSGALAHRYFRHSLARRDPYAAGRLDPCCGTSRRHIFPSAPAVLDCSWTDASISDALRLIRGDDYGVRGSLAVTVSARAGDEGWKFRGRAEMRQLHRWDLPCEWIIPG